MRHIPVIDIEDPNIGSHLFDAFTTIGFAAITLSSKNWHLLRSIREGYDEAERFFSQTTEEKMKWFDSALNGQRGFTPFKTEKAKDQTVPDLKEFLQFGGDNNLAPERLLCVYGDLFAQLDSIAEYLMESLSSFILMSKEILKQTVNGQTILRIIHYPPTSNMEGMRSAPHEDINFITLLPAASAAGLQVFDRGGDEWLDAPTWDNTLIVNVGDMLQEYTGGLLKSTTHRVINTEEGKTKPRFSMPFFYHPPGNFYLSEKYPRAELYLDERLREIGLKK